ncbi:MAG: NAD(P)H-dependent oxidoreductase [Alphaproteobacteria bacterium]|nr:NAD(P)H-dependent oxidoreductase [Alphaproteobacteria bacterium]MBV9371409.1 NAD(P)H-dependent oxidoreductase [Alphaproteobacteria bacterium]MBV9902346.1 NAD(P)H-dependent oxidoreductase [Alphaproteobacteria bacterium]
MPRSRNVALIVGSLREGSLNRRAAQVMIGMAPTHLAFDFVPIGDLPLYNEDVEASPPPAWQAFRDRVGPADAVLFVTPEYNRSVPGGLKNAIDVGSRPYGKSVWAGKPAAVATVSPGGIGGFGANHHLRQSLVFLDMPVMQQPEAYFGGAGGWFDKEGALASQATEKVMRTFIEAFARWIERVSED